MAYRNTGGWVAFDVLMDGGVGGLWWAGGLGRMADEDRRVDGRYLMYWWVDGVGGRARTRCGW